MQSTGSARGQEGSPGGAGKGGGQGLSPARSCSTSPGSCI